VDNASTDDSLDYVGREHPWVEVLTAATNLGWAGGNNLGIRRALDMGADYVLLANNDIRVHPQWVAAAVEAACSDARIGAVGFAVIGAMRPGSLEDFDAAAAAWTSTAWQPTDVIHGLALFVRAEVFRRIGLIDEAYFVYAEENDFELRLQAAGYRMVETNVPVWHYSQGYFRRFRRFPVKGSFLAMRNAIRLGLKNYTCAGALREICAVAHMACNPFFRGDRTNVCIQRLRPRNVLGNGVILLAALAWNLWHLPGTLAARRRDRQRVAAARRALLGEDGV